MKSIDLTKIKRVLIIRPRAIGDALLTTPFVRALHKALPLAEIDYVIEPFASQVLEGNPYINNIFLMERHSMKKEPANIRAIKKNRLKKQGLFVRMIEAIKFYNSLRKRKYDIVFDLWCNLRTAFLSYLTGAGVRVGFAFRGRKFFYNLQVTPDPAPKYNAFYHMDLLKAVGIADDGWQTEFYLKSRDEEFADKFYAAAGVKAWEKVIGLNGAGSWVTKRWPEHKLSGLADMIVREMPGVKIIVLWGPGEKEMAERIISGMKEDASRVLLSPETDLKQLGAIIKRMDVLVTNDGGPGHIAVALRVPTVTVFGPTNYKSWAPEGSATHLTAAGAPDCAPCDRMACPPALANRCMEMVTEAEVFEKLKAAMAAEADEKIKNKSC